MHRSSLVPAMMLGLILFSGPAPAIVNIEGVRDSAGETGLAGRIDASLSGASGNTDKASLSLGTRLQWKRDDTTELLILDYAYGESNDVQDTNRAFAHLRHTRQYAPRRAWEAFTQAEEDEFTRLGFRGLLGGGLRFTLAESDASSVHLGTGAFYARETLDEAPGLTDGGTRNFWRANLYLALRYDISASAGLANTVYYQPETGDLHDYRLLDEAALRVRLTDRLDLKLSLQVTHDSRPPQSVEETDIDYLTGIEYRF